ncbi:sister chromatid cohesion protein DCC1 [Microdochium nivale]|nr:sister chromatid cohesion protein DCC1 [Microdochium nivale]
MSSQADVGISLIHAPDGVGYKLLELPPELLALLESDEPPIITIESSSASAVLKTASHSWGLRQKNTSNALILLQAEAPASVEASSAAEMPVPRLKAISTLHDTIELVTEPSATAVPTTRGKWHEKFAKGR